MKFYHATTERNMVKIVHEKRIRKSMEGVYLCKDPVDACKFLVMRGVQRVSVIEAELDEKDVEESNDHSEGFFRCKAYIHQGDISLTGREWIFKYNFGEILAKEM